MGEWHQLFADIYDTIFVKWKYLYLWLVACLLSFSFTIYAKKDTDYADFIHKNSFVLG